MCELFLILRYGFELMLMLALNYQVQGGRYMTTIKLKIDEISYDYLCTTFDFHNVWRKELACEGRDYAIGMRLPFYMQQLGLHDIDARMNDKVMYVNPDMKNYHEKVQDFIEINGWNRSFSISNQKNTIELLMNRGIPRV